MNTAAAQAVTLHIERIVLDGLPLGAAQAAQLQAALQGELARLLQRDAACAPFAGGAMPRLAAPALQVSMPVRPLELARAIAHSVYQSLGRSP